MCMYVYPYLSQGRVPTKTYLNCRHLANSPKQNAYGNNECEIPFSYTVTYFATTKNLLLK